MTAILCRKRKLSALMTKCKFFPGLLLVVALLGGLGCSVGTLLVRVPTLTPQPTKTPRPTFTFTPNWTPTPTPSPTATLTPVPPTATPTSAATQTPTPGPTATRTRRPTNTPAPQAPTDTPTPAPPAATPTPKYTFDVTDQVVHNIIGGVALEVRVTGYIVIIKDASKGYYDCGDGYQIALVDPSGREHLSGPSGGRNHTTGVGLGDDHWFSAEVKFSPYTPGPYKARLVKDGVQQSPEVEFTLPGSAAYVWLQFESSLARGAAIRPCGG